MPSSLTKSQIEVGSTTFDFISLRGEPSGLQERVEEITRPGVDGHAYAMVGMKAERFEMIGSRDYDDFADAKADLASMEAALPGELVTLYDDFGVEYENVMVFDVQKIELRPALTAVGGKSTSKGALMRVRFVMQIAGATA